MGNMFLKKTNFFNNDNKDLYSSLLHTNINERINYIEDKLDNLDNDFYVFRDNTNANIKVISKDIHLLYTKKN